MAFNPPDGNQTIMVDKDSVLQNPQNIFTTSPVVCQKGWHYNYIDKSGIGSASTWESKNSVLVLYLSESFVLESATGGVENPDFVSGFAVGDTVSFVDDNHMVDAFEITAISGNKITIKGGDKSDAYEKINEAANGWVGLKRGQVLNNDYSLYCTAKPTVGNSIMLSGTISNGTNLVLGSEAFVWGRGNVVKSDKSFTAGDGLLNDTYNCFVAGRFNAPNPDNDPFIIGMGTSDANRQNGLAVGGYGTTESYLKTTKDNFRFNKPVKIDGTTSSRVVATDANNKLSTTSTTTTELGYLSGAKSNIQTQINNLTTSTGSKAEKDASNLSADNVTSWKEKLDIDTLEAEIDTKATKATTLSGYGIVDAKIANSVITLGDNTIEPLTKDSTIAASKISGTVASATKATQDGDGNIISTTYAKAGDLALKQDKTDNTLTTTDKTIVGAINEVNSALAGNTDELGLTQILKLGAGQLWFNRGVLSVESFANLPVSLPISLCIEYDVDSWAGLGSAINDGIMFFATRDAVFTTPPQYKGFYLRYYENGQIFFNCANVGATPQLSRFSAQSINGGAGLPTGRHTLVVCVGGTIEGGKPSEFAMYLDGVALPIVVLEQTITSVDITSSKALVVAQADNYSNAAFIGGAKVPVRLSRVRIFNFQMDADVSPYSVADYAAGKLVPPVLYDPAAAQRALLALEDYTIDRNMTTRLVKDISGNAYDATVVESGSSQSTAWTGTVKGSQDSAVAAFVDELKTQIAQSTATT